MNSPTQFDLRGAHAIIKGLPWTFDMTRYQANGQPVDLTGCRARIEFFDALAATRDPITTLSTESGEIVLGGASGNLKARLDSDTSAAWQSKTIRWLLFFTDSLGADDAYLFGNVDLKVLF